MLSLRRLASVLFLCLVSLRGVATAATVTIDFDEVPLGTDIRTYYPGVTFEQYQDRGNQFFSTLGPTNSPIVTEDISSYGSDAGVFAARYYSDPFNSSRPNDPVNFDRYWLVVTFAEPTNYFQVDLTLYPIFNSNPESVFVEVLQSPAGSAPIQTITYPVGIDERITVASSSADIVGFNITAWGHPDDGPTDDFNLVSLKYEAIGIPESHSLIMLSFAGLLITTYRLLSRRGLG